MSERCLMMVTTGENECPKNKRWRNMLEEIWGDLGLRGSRLEQGWQVMAVVGKLQGREEWEECSKILGLQGGKADARLNPMNCDTP